MRELEELLDWVEHLARSRKMNAEDYELYKRKLIAMELEDGYEQAIRRLTEAMRF